VAIKQRAFGGIVEVKDLILWLPNFEVLVDLIAGYLQQLSFVTFLFSDHPGLALMFEDPIIGTVPPEEARVNRSRFQVVIEPEKII
jgi:hypothetical protein